MIGDLGKHSGYKKLISYLRRMLYELENFYIMSESTKLWNKFFIASRSSRNPPKNATRVETPSKSDECVQYSFLLSTNLINFQTAQNVFDNLNDLTLATEGKPYVRISSIMGNIPLQS